ncbi:interleukin-4 receptor subunit alpha [Paroedura picta]|uniref:interleukin-4 receptor subunit alpha n=1 Tax=Paroedura picta TaxID=143630 RepID=UPI004056BE4A
MDSKEGARHSTGDQGVAALNQGNFKVDQLCQHARSHGKLPCSFRLGAQRFPDLHCYTDYETKVVCHWDVIDTTNCAEEFKLLVKNNIGQVKATAFREGGRLCGLPSWERFPNSLPECFRSHQPSVVIVVPPPPRRIPPLGLQALINVTEKTSHHKVFPATLSPGKKHTARVRYRMPMMDTCWSEWSSPSRWLNDFQQDPGEQSWWPIPVICCLVAVLVLTCYCCLVRLKRRWWDQIPSPKINDDLGKKPAPLWWQVPPGGKGKAPVCAPSQHLTPEDPPVEPFLRVDKPVADPDAETPVEEEEGQAPHNNALVDLFLDILGGGDGTEDAAPPESPPARAPEPALGGTPRGSPGESSDSGNGNVAPSSRAASPTPEQHQGDDQPCSSSQYKLLLFPQPGSPGQVVVTESMGGSKASGPGGSVATATPQPSCYRSLSGLMGPPSGPRVDQAPVPDSLPPGREDKLSLSPCPPDSCLPGYRPLKLASQEPHSLGLGSPYKPLLEVFSSTAKEGPREVWTGAPWPEPLALAFSRCMEEEEEEEEEEEGSSQAGIRPGTEGSLPIASF